MLRRLLLSLLLPLLLAAAPARADDGIEVQSAHVTVHGDVFEFSARTIFPLDDDVRTALTDGATVYFDLQAMVVRHRRYWLDATVLDTVLRRALTWNAVSQRYVLTDADGVEQESFTALDAALIAAGQVRQWPVRIEQGLDPEASYEIRVRAGFRRGRLSSALRAVMFWSDDWKRRSRWYSWILPR